MPGPVRAAVEVAVLRGRRGGLFAPGRARHVPAAGGERLEDRIEPPHDVRLAADHHAVAALETPDASRSPDVDVVEAARRELLRAPDVVDVVGVPAVDQDIARA